MQNDFQQQLKSKSGIVSNIINFNSFITPKIIKFFYWILLFCLAIFLVVTVFTGLYLIINGLFLNGLKAIFIGLLGTILYWFLIRMSMEMTILAFKNNEYLKKISEK